MLEVNTEAVASSLIELPPGAQDIHRILNDIRNNAVRALEGKIRERTLQGMRGIRALIKNHYSEIAVRKSRLEAAVNNLRDIHEGNPDILREMIFTLTDDAQESFDYCCSHFPSQLVSMTQTYRINLGERGDALLSKIGEVENEYKQYIHSLQK